MKKFLAALLVIICLFALVGCDPDINTINKDELLAGTIKIELYDYENENPKLVNINSHSKPSFDFNKATLIGTLDEKHFESLLSEVAECYYTYYGRALNEPMRKTLVLHQSNGNMIVLFGCIYESEKSGTYYYGDCYVFDKNGVFIELIGDVGYLFLDHVESTYFKDNS
ncbi:MAG: hypothetical protein J6D27_05915 [Ruminiclostridium sp.]|nr:hypothetical protein [Ruminiclostridium sp.]